MALLAQPDNSYELALLQQGISQVLGDEALVIEPELRAYRDEFVRGMVYQLRGYILADHLENQTVTYTETILPRWLKWLSRFVTTRNYEIKMDAYYTYPKARIALPNLGRGRKVITFSKTRIPRFL